jgi:hypothetical protein
MPVQKKMLHEKYLATCLNLFELLQVIYSTLLQPKRKIVNRHFVIFKNNKPEDQDLPTKLVMMMMI